MNKTVKKSLQQENSASRWFSWAGKIAWSHKIRPIVTGGRITCRLKKIKKGKRFLIFCAVPEPPIAAIAISFSTRTSGIFYPLHKQTWAYNIWKQVILSSKIFKNLGAAVRHRPPLLQGNRNFNSLKSGMEMPAVLLLKRVV
jgi:hypothetical protein